MEKSKLIIKKTWGEFGIYCALSLSFLGVGIYSFWDDFNAIMTLFPLAIIVMFSVVLFTAYPGSYMLFDQNGITCVKKVPFSPQSVVHYDWKSYKEVSFYNGRLLLIKEKAAVPIKCQDYCGSVIYLNGKRKICLLAPSFGPYIGIICKENNIPFKDYPYPASI